MRQVTTGSGSGTATRDTRGVRSSTARDGTQTTVTLLPHPRYGMDAPLRRTQTRLPSGLTRVTESSAMVELGAGGDDVVTETRTTTLNGKTATGRWDAASGTWTTTSAQGRTVVTTLDAQGQVSGMTRGGMAPLTVERDAAGGCAPHIAGNNGPMKHRAPLRGHGLVPNANEDEASAWLVRSPRCISTCPARWPGRQMMRCWWRFLGCWSGHVR